MSVPIQYVHCRKFYVMFLFFFSTILMRQKGIMEVWLTLLSALVVVGGNDQVSTCKLLK